MDIYDFYITPEEYEKAARIGIKGRVLEYRIRDLGWDKEKAINTPLKIKTIYPKGIRELARKNGISNGAFYQRVHVLEWNLVKAATEPIENKHETVVRAREAYRKYDKKYLEMAALNGISSKTFYDRVKKLGWTLERACTQKTLSSKEVIKNLISSNIENPSYFRKTHSYYTHFKHDYKKISL